jgi:hypothetical protein
MSVKILTITTHLSKRSYNYCVIVVKTKIDLSKIPNAGNGLFAAQAIPVGMAVAINRPGTYYIYSQKDFEGFEDSFKNFIRDFGCLKNGVWKVDKGRDKFINHSRNSNLTFDGVARRNIAAGEELTYDYREIDDNMFLNPPSWL